MRRCVKFGEWECVAEMVEWAEQSEELREDCEVRAVIREASEQAAKERERGSKSRKVLRGDKERSMRAGQNGQRILPGDIQAKQRDSLSEKGSTPVHQYSWQEAETREQGGRDGVGEVDSCKQGSVESEEKLARMGMAWNECEQLGKPVPSVLDILEEWR